MFWKDDIAYIILMASNEDKVDAILDQMQKENDPQAFS